jgi:hypothetical protein
MAQAKAAEVAAIAKGLLDKPLIPYTSNGSTLAGMDCQGLVEYCIRTAGGKINYAGSNDMFRHACTWLGKLEQAKREGKLIPGAIVFMHETDGNEPAKYKGDGLGNASHVGVYVGDKTIYSVDASASAGKVRARDKRNAEGYVWTHVGWFREVDYMVKPPQTPDEPDEIEQDAGQTDDIDVSEPPTPSPQTPRSSPPPRSNRPLPARGRVYGSQRLNLRKSPRPDGERIGGMEPGTELEIQDEMGEWMKVRAKIGREFFTGWALSQYIQL